MHTSVCAYYAAADIHIRHTIIERVNILIKTKYWKKHFVEIIEKNAQTRILKKSARGKSLYFSYVQGKYVFELL